MPTLKSMALNLINRLPDNCTIEDIQYELYFKTKVEKGLKDIKKKNLLTEEEMDKERQKWHK